MNSRVKYVPLPVLLSLIASCNHQAEHATTLMAAPSSRPATEAASANADEEARKQVESMMEIGEARVLKPGGPQFELPSSYFVIACKYPLITLELIKQRLHSTDDQVRCNAYDFLIHLMDVPESRDEARRILLKADKTEIWPIQKFIEPKIVTGAQ
jgi:hypothetical protein